MVFVTCRPSLNPNAVLDDIGPSMIEEESMVQNGKLQVPIRKGRSLITEGSLEIDENDNIEF